MRSTRLTQTKWISDLMVAAGLTIGALAYLLFFVPGKIAPGGLTGVAQLIERLTGLPIGLTAIALNVPLFALSIRRMGLRFGVRSLLAMIAFSLLIDYLPLRVDVGDRMLAAVIGGVVAGLGFGLVLRGGATTGGTDMLARLLHRALPVISVGAVLFAVDALVVFMASLVFDPMSAMYSLIALYISSQVVDLVLAGLNAAKAYYIISDKHEVIARRIMEELDRGVTGLKGQGMYSGTEKMVLLCVAGRLESAQLRRIVAEEDGSAFVIAASVNEVFGEGFTPHTD